MFKETFLKLFWTNIHKKHCEKLATKPTSVLLIFTTFYQYEKKFSELSNLKTSKWNRSQTEDDLRITLHQIDPRKNVVTGSTFPH